MKKWIRQHWRTIARIVAFLLLLGSAFVAYFWFYAIAPLRHTLDPSWFRRHSVEAYWTEVRTGIQRYRWGHHDPVGLYADANFMSWAMAHMEPGEDISGCGGGHRDSDFRQIANQDVGESATEWLAWWKKNGSKPQEEWIRDGFTHYGVTVAVPPSDADTTPLLTLLGNMSTNKTDQIPGFVKYNAFRWLRDSGFNPVAFAVSNLTASTQAEVKTGLLEYLRQERIFPKRDHVGELMFGKTIDPYAGYCRPAMLEPGFKIGVYGLVFGLPCVAAGLIAWTLRGPRQRDRNVEQRRP
jgi:hypothetical protein